MQLSFVSKLVAVKLHSPSGRHYRISKVWLMPVPVAAQSKAWFCGRSPAEIVGSNPTGGAWMSVCCECSVLSGTGLCDEPITCPEKSYKLWCVVVSDLETSWMRRPWSTGGLSRQKQIYIHSPVLTFNKFVNIPYIINAGPSGRAV